METGVFGHGVFKCLVIVIFAIGIEGGGEVKPLVPLVEGVEGGEGGGPGGDGGGGEVDGGGGGHGVGAMLWTRAVAGGHLHTGGQLRTIRGQQGRSYPLVSAGHGDANAGRRRVRTARRLNGRGERRGI